MTRMEPALLTASELLGVQRELARREPIFHRREFAATREQFDDMMDSGFWEVGASGRRYSREFVLETLSTRPRTADEDLWRTEGFHCREIAPDHFLLTYTLRQGARVTRRATLWRRTGEGWKVLFHQGTLVEGE